MNYDLFLLLAFYRHTSNQYANKCNYRRPATFIKIGDIAIRQLCFGENFHNNKKRSKKQAAGIISMCVSLSHRNTKISLQAACQNGLRCHMKG